MTHKINNDDTDFIPKNKIELTRKVFKYSTILKLNTIKPEPYHYEVLYVK